MKINPLNISILFLAIFVGLSSCKKDDNTSEDNSNSSDFYFNVKIDGKSVTGDLSNAKTFKAIKYPHGAMTLLTITVMKDDANQDDGSFLINVPNYEGAKSYEIKGSARYRSAGANWSSTVTSPGTVTITSDKNNVVAGTFSFDGYNATDLTTKKLTEGKFRLKVQP